MKLSEAALNVSQGLATPSVALDASINLKKKKKTMIVVPRDDK